LIGQLKLLIALWYRPATAMGDILDRGSLVFAAIATLLAGLALPFGSFYTPMLLLAVVYVPGVLLIASPIARASFGRDYAPLLTCAAMAWTAAQLPIYLPARLAVFAILMFFAVRTVFGTGNATTAAIVAFSAAPLAAALFFWPVISMIFSLLASPFVLFYLIYYLGAEFRGLGDTLRSGQNYRRMLEAAAINPHDGDAQYQLGLIHQHRRQLSEAVRRFEAAVAIDPTETDAHYQLARIYRQQGRLDDALRHLEIAVRQDDKHSTSEIHRELGAVYLALDRLPDALRELTLYTARREYDPEGLYYYGQTLDRLTRPEEARDSYARAVESARTAPRYRRPELAQWSRLAARRL
jgi:tetratricopeptide (TPR) repeat protein